jgi:antirestriction protein ArdC
MTATLATFADLLRSAVSDPGVLSAAYRQFHNYSLGNQLLAWSQCLSRGMQPGPLATYPRWRELGRQVRRGEKAITLCMPVTVKHAHETENGDDVEVFTRFIYRPNWFVLTQTDGEPLSTALVSIMSPQPGSIREASRDCERKKEVRYLLQDQTLDAKSRAPSAC